MFDWNYFLTNLAPDDTSKKTDNLLQLCPLSQYQLIIVDGPDAQKFLQGQCTCDFAKLTLENFTYGAHCTPKGRMISSFLAAKTAENQFILRTNSDCAIALLNGLKKYAVFSKVTLTISDTLASFGLFGDKSGLDSVLVNNELHTANIKRIVEHTNAYELWLDPSSITHSPLSKLPTASPHEWDLMLVRNGIGEVREKTIEALLPQEINLQLIGGIDFKKGCYTGQEIIARMHYRGQLKKHMYRGIISGISGDSSTLDYHYLSDINSGKNIGQILFSAKNCSNNIEFVAIVNDEHTTNHLAQLTEFPTAKIEWLPLPYAIT